MSELEEGIARLESTLAGTRLNAQRALRELHVAMRRDLRRAERRAERAERRVEELRTELRGARRRLRRLERRPAGASTPGRGVGQVPGRVLRRLRDAVRRS